MTTAIRVHDVSTRFRINANKSLKEVLVNFRQTRDNLHDFWALRDVSLEVEDGTTLGLIGHNGSGKSTLLKVIGGILTPTSGYVERRERLAALLELGAGFHGDLTGRENVFLNAAILGMSRKATAASFDEIVDFSGIEQFIDTPVKFYSSGMYVRLAFAVAVNVDPDILLVDEVLAVGDEAFQRKCLDKIRSFQRDGKTIVFVTHGLDLARELCDRVVLLDHGRVESTATRSTRCAGSARTSRSSPTPSAGRSRPPRSATGRCSSSGSTSSTPPGSRATGSVPGSRSASASPWRRRGGSTTGSSASPSRTSSTSSATARTRTCSAWTWGRSRGAARCRSPFRACTSRKGTTT